MKYRTVAIASTLALFVHWLPAAGHDDTAGASSGRPPEKLGNVSFPTSCDPKVQPLFERGVALLHSFWFPEGLKTFNEIAQADPSCGIAYWGIGVNRLLNPFGGQPAESVLLQGQDAVDKGKAIGARTQRERDYIDAVAMLYTHDRAPWRERVLRYEKAMEQLTQRYPEDKEAAIFFALALNVAADLNDKTYARQLRAAAILEQVFAGQPDHPGVAHYLIHSYDYPPIADQGLAAARRYAAIAPSAAHALHMPSHIFTRVGAWEDSIAGNRRSENTARANRVPDEILHAIDYQVYAALQLARDAEAKGAIERGEAEAGRYERNAGAYSLAAGPARYALERGDWKMAAQLTPRSSKFPYADAMTYLARALGSARSGNPAAARADIEQLVRLREALRERKDAYWTEIVDIQRVTAEAWATLAEGRGQEALALMREAAEREDATEKATVTPGALAPARELLGEMLLELKQPAQALKEFEISARHEPNRFRGTLGIAMAAERSGDSAKAKMYYAKLKELAAKGDPRPELQRTEAFLARGN
jgi:tetratricopeptide (TPR) repeat protein